MEEAAPVLTTRPELRPCTPALARTAITATPTAAPTVPATLLSAEAQLEHIQKLTKGGSEHGQQMAVFQWAAFNRAKYPVLRWLYAIPNGGGRSASQGAMLKAEGVKSGVSDICLPVARGGYHGLYIEMKKEHGIPSDVSAAQKEFIEFVLEQGYHAEVAFGWEKAVAILEAYLNSVVK